MRKQNNILSFHLVTLKVQAIVTVCYEWIHTFNTEFWSLQTDPPWGSLCHFSILWLPSWFLIGLKIWKSPGVASPHTAWPQQPCCSILNESLLNIHCTALTWHHITFIYLFIYLFFMFLCRSSLVVTISKMLGKCKRLFYSGSLYQIQKSVVKPVLGQSYSDCCSSQLPCRLHCCH
jgi:hypothetical protein